MARIVGFRRKVHAFVRLSPFEQAWFGPVWLLLGLSRLAILTVSFRRLAPLLGHRTKNPVVVPLVTEAERARARRIGRIVRLAARHTPWTSNCFPQAIAARVLLGLHGVPYALYFGLSNEGGGKTRLMAHAWVCAGPVAATGGNGFRQFTVVEAFMSTDSSPPSKPKVRKP